MPIDISKKSFKPSKNYAGVIHEQGRVMLDSEWNEAISINDRRWRAETLDIFGRCRVPRETPDAFKIAIGNGTLTIGAGRIYVDGLLAENHGGLPLQFDPTLAELTGTGELPFEQQPFLIEMNLNDIENGRYLIYLDVWYRDVTYIEDPELVEKAVGIPTASRRQTVWQVRIHDQAVGDAVVCSTPDENIAGWEDLVSPSDGRLSTRAVGVSSIDDPCLLPPSGGYRGLENRTYRVEIHSVADDGSATFKWSMCNATVTSAVNAIPSLDQLNVESTNKDSVMRFNNGDWVEIIDDPLEFSDQPGIIRRIEFVNNTTRTITLTEPLPADVFPTSNGNLDPTRHTRVRRWDQSGEVRDTDNNMIIDLDAQNSEGIIPIPEPDSSIILEDGVEITFDLASPEGRYRAGDYWVFTTRTIDASVENLDHEPPCGIHHHYCRLALVDIVDHEFTALVEDCRIVTPEDSPALRGCCSVTVQIGESIQSAIDSLPVQGGKICLFSGEYRENVRIENRRDITLTGCGRRTRIISTTPDGEFGEASPVVDIINSTGIHIESMNVVGHTTGVGILVEERAADHDEAEVLQVADILLDGLYINAASRSGIEIQAGMDVTIRGCHVDMEDTISDWPGIFLIAQDALIQDNEIRVLPTRRTENRILNGRGGIQIGGTSERIRIKNNFIQNGTGNGVTLGSLEEIEDNGFVINSYIPWRPVSIEEPCDECEPITPRIPPNFPVDLGGDGESDDGRDFQSSGTLYDITIEGNRIYGMGLNGIGVAGFFDLSLTDEFITVNGLSICKNEIHNCLNRPLAPIDAGMVNSMGYGGIALSDVENLVICHNNIENNGPRFLEPICGIFVLHAEGVDISDNRILNNGAKIKTTEAPEQGRRGGINIVLAIAPTVPTVIGYSQNSGLVVTRFTRFFPRQNGVPAAKIHDNIVSQPVGRALNLTALGPVSVLNNQFTSRGVPTLIGRQTQASIGATVVIVNLGISNELYGKLYNFSGIVTGRVGTLTNVMNIEEGSVVRPHEGLDDLRVGQYLVNGNVLFSNNQCVLDLLETGLSRLNSSVFVVSLDDIGFDNNQCDSALFDDFLYVQTFVMGLSVRVNDNRFKEGISNASYSAITIGLMNATTNNQATHCLLIKSLLPNNKVDSGNMVLYESVVEGYCSRSWDALNNTTFILRDII